MSSEKQLLFTVEEYQQRVRDVRAHMRERQIDVLLIDQTEFLFWLTGFGISENMYRACLLPLDGEPVMIFRTIDESTFVESSWMTSMVTFSDWQQPLDVLTATLTERGWHQGRLGLDQDSYCMTINRFRALRQRLPQTEIVDFSGILEQVRECKSEQELAYIGRAALVGDEAFTRTVAAAGPGTTERQAAATLHQVFMEQGLDTNRCGIITAGVGNSFLHGNLHDRPLAVGDVLHMELLPFCHGYSARMMRPVVIGSASDEQHRLAQQLIAIQDRQLAAMRPGAHANEIDALARDAMLAAGLRTEYVNITGYSLGYYPLSSPHTSDFSRVFLPEANWRLKSGMVFHMYVSAAGIAFSETVLVTPNGHQRLTQTERRLFIANAI